MTPTSRPIPPGIETDAAARATSAAAGLGEQYRAIRERTDWLAAPLTPEDCAVQSMTDASPTKWHLGHTSWFFETFVLATGVPGYREFDPDFGFIFNSYYDTVGEQYPRPDRGLLSRPSLERVREYRRHVDERMEGLFRGEVSPEMAGVIEIGLNHEQQHQELILTDIKHLFSANPAPPAYRECPESALPGTVSLDWHRYAEGLAWIGDAGHGFAYDNERPRHRRFLEAFELASRPITNGEFLDFIHDGGYARPELWLSEGWATIRQRRWCSPLYWMERDGEWSVVTLGGRRRLRAQDPACHLSYFEADAYARWAGARLPTEVEWEIAAVDLAIDGNFVEAGLLHPAPATGMLSNGPAQMFGDVWEWTQSPYTAYPGFTTPPGALGEYNGKFMCNQFVLRGGSCASPRSHLRATYRNFFPPDARWQFTGARLARDAG